MIGEQFLHYRIIRQLGAGGMGVVYEAEDTRLGRRVALKFLPETIGLAPDAVERFEREARIASSLNHPNICTIHDIGVENGRRVIVMELLEGESLRSRIQGQPLPIDLVIDVGCQIADALDAAHAKGIVHRDIKPANVFLTRRGQAKLLDFGVAKLGGDAHEPAAADETRAADALTMPGMAIGSINYMSPEQARGEDIDNRTDLFSLGVVLYEMATGRQAFGGQTTAVVFDAILNRQPPDPRAVNPGLPEELLRVMARALEKDRRMRFQSAADMLAELSRVRRDTTGRSLATGATTAGANAAASPAAIGQTVSSVQVPAGSSATAAWSLTPPAAGTPAAAGTAAARPSRAGLWGKVAVGVAVVGAAAYYFLGPGTPAAPAFTERDTVLIADFINTTGETVFDDALKQAVAVQMQQTPYVTLLPDQAVQRTLRLMQRDDDTAVTGAVARELCQRAGARASVEGSIAPLGRAYVLTLGVYNCATGASIAQQQAQAGAKEEVLNKVGEVVTALRQGLGESLASIEKYDVPVTEATTASLDALKSYGLGLRTRVTRGDDTAIPFFLQAVEADPEFALAWAKLSVLYSNRGRTAEARDAATKAFELRGRVSEYERMYIDWSYATRVLQDDTKTREILEFMTTAYPRDFTARNNFGVYYMARSDYERAIAQFQVAIEVAPGEPLPHANMAYALFNLGRFDEAVASAERAQAIRPDGGLATTLWMTAVVRGDARAEAFRQSAEKLATPAQMQNARASVAAWGGRLDEFAGLVRALKDGVEPGPNAAEQRAGLDLFEAANLVLLDGPSHLAALRRLQSASMPPRVRAQAVAIETALGDPARVAGALRDLEALGRTDPAVSGPTAMARAYSLARQGQFDEALARAQALVREQSQERDLLLHVGRIRELQGDLDGAIRDYQLVTGQVSSAGINLFAPLARLWLADALIRQGRAVEARPHLDALLAQWKDADREFALLTRARELRAKAGA